MNMKRIISFAFVLLCLGVKAQNVGINGTGAAPDASAMLDVVATDKGLLVPRVALTATNAAGPVTSPTTSLLVYNTATAGTAPNNVTPGYYYWNGSAWVRFVIENKFNINFTNGVGTSMPNSTNYYYISATGVLRNTAQNITPNMSGAAPVNDVFIFTATSTCVLSKFNMILATALVSRPFSIDIYKYSQTANSTTLPVGTALITTVTFTSSATSLGNTLVTANGNGTLIQPGDVICVMLKNGHNATNNLYLSGSLEFLSK